MFSTRLPGTFCVRSFSTVINGYTLPVLPATLRYRHRIDRKRHLRELKSASDIPGVLNMRIPGNDGYLMVSFAKSDLAQFEKVVRRPAPVGNKRYKDNPDIYLVAKLSNGVEAEGETAEVLAKLDVLTRHPTTEDAINVRLVRIDEEEIPSSWSAPWVAE